MLERAFSEQTQYDFKPSTNLCKELMSLKACQELIRIQVLHRDCQKLWRLSCTVSRALPSLCTCFLTHTEPQQLRKGKKRVS